MSLHKRTWGILCSIALLLHLVFILINYSSLPEQIPTHFNIFGKADAWGSKNSIWFLWFVNFGLYGLFLGLERWISQANLKTMIGLNMPESWKADSTGQIKALLQEMFSVYNLSITALFSALSAQIILTAHNRSTLVPQIAIVIISLLMFLFIWIYYRKMSNSQKELSSSKK